MLQNTGNHRCGNDLCIFGFIRLITVFSDIQDFRILPDSCTVFPFFQSPAQAVLSLSQNRKVLPESTLLQVCFSVWIHC